MIITKTELFEEKERYAREIAKGAVFLHPTDTINGLGAAATHDEAVKKLRRIKKNPHAPLSIIVPSKAWIRENCEVPIHAEEWLAKLPGPYTLVLNLKNKNAVSKHVNPKNDTIGVRIPKHWISEFVEHIGEPIISTIANVSGEEYSHDIDEVHDDISNNTNFMIYEAYEKGKPSEVIDLTGDKAEIITRR